jgi:hypothetical protein
MERAAQVEAAGGQAALPAEFTTDPVTLARVISELRKDAPTVDVLSRHDHLPMPAHTLERRTYTLLHSTQGSL